MKKENQPNNKQEKPNINTNNNNGINADNNNKRERENKQYEMKKESPTYTRQEKPIIINGYNHKVSTNYKIEKAKINNDKSIRNFFQNLIYDIQDLYEEYSKDYMHVIIALEINVTIAFFIYFKNGINRIILSLFLLYLNFFCPK